MSDEPGQSEQQNETMTATETSDKWGDPISPERQAELQEYLDRWAAETERGERVGPLANVKLTGADVSWLAEQSGRDEHGRVPNLHLEGADLREAHLEGANLTWAHLESADFSEAHLEHAQLGLAHLEHAQLGYAHLEHAQLDYAQLEIADLVKARLDSADLSSANLENAALCEAHLERANLSLAYLEGADLMGAYLQRATLTGAHLQRATLREAHLEGATLREAHLEGANLTWAHLESADLIAAHLERATLFAAHLERADLTGAWFDKASRLNDAILTSASLDQVTFDQTNLTVVDWSLVQTLGDEQTARAPKDKDNKPKTRGTRLGDYKSAVRANRILSVALQDQGLSEDASRFAYHAQVLQREVYRRQRRVGAYLFSLLIAAMAGYGYKLGRILIAYGLSLAVFAAAYFTAGQWFGATHLTWYQAILVSLTAIHGRVFFESFGLNNVSSG